MSVCVCARARARAYRAGVQAVACGADHSVLLLANGSALACGANDFGQLGVGPDARLSDVFALFQLAVGAHAAQLMASTKGWGPGGDAGGDGDVSQEPDAVPEVVCVCVCVCARARAGARGLFCLCGHA